jgi:cobalt-zinc-cadmium efflux system membrane fusion protein
MNRHPGWGWLALGVLLVLGSACKRTSAPTEKTTASAAPAKSSHATSATAAAVKLCVHGVPADQCTKCNPDLIPAFKELGDWCEHGLPKSHCRQCNPSLTFTAPQDWCKEHAVPESKCTKCNPSLIPKFIAAGDFCREHGYPESVCPYCHPELPKAAGQPAPQFPPPGSTVKLASAETATDVGIRTTRVEKRDIARTLEVVGQLSFNENRHAQLSARGEALVLEVKVDVGDDVRAGQPLLVLASAAVGGHQAQLAGARARVETARSALQRERGLAQRGVSPRKNAEEAERELGAAEAEYNGAKASLAASGATEAGSGGRYVLPAPFAGTIVGRDAVVGKSASPDQVLIQVADLRTMWAELDVPEADASWVKAGQAVALTFEGARTPPTEAQITRVAASVDQRTRAVRARVELPNPERNLKAGTFLHAKIQIATATPALLLPLDAVQTTQGSSFVFVKKGEGVYEPVAVKVGPRTAEGTEVLDGLSPGAEVVTTGAFLLKTEVLKDSIGAGCCDEGSK